MDEVRLTIYTNMHSPFHVEACMVALTAREHSMKAVLRDPSFNRDHSISSVPAIVVSIGDRAVKTLNIRQKEDLDDLFNVKLSPRKIMEYSQREAIKAAEADRQKQEKENRKAAKAQKRRELLDKIAAREDLDEDIQLVLMMLLGGKQ